MGGNVGDTGDKDSTTKTHILTPGDKGEWALTGKENETIIARASSRIFDPAIEVVDDKGKILAQNDDIALGEQDALVLYRFPKAGDYKVWVKGYKSAAGGEYTFMLRRFVARELKPGDRVSDALEATDSKWFRIALQKGQILTSTIRGNGFAPKLQIFAPNGTPIEEPGLNQRSSPVKDFVAEQDGEHYIRVGGHSPNSAFSIAALLAREATTTINSETGLQPLEADGLHIWTLNGKSGELIKVEAGTNGPIVRVDFEQVGGDDSPPVLLANDEKRNRATYFLLRKDASYQCRIRQFGGQETQYNLRVLPSTEGFGESALDGQLGMGQAKFYEFNGQTGDIWRISGSAQTFDVQMALLSETGERISSNRDVPGSTDSQILALLPTNGRYILQLECEGGGGAGAFQLEKLQVQPKLLTVNSRQSAVATSSAQEIWRLEGEAGKTILISVRSSKFNPTVVLRGPDGREIKRDEDGGDGSDSLLSVKLPASGTYTIWIFRSSVGEGEYDLRVIDLDS